MTEVSPVVWYLGACLTAFSVGFVAGLIHKAILQVAEHIT